MRIGDDNMLFFYTNLLGLDQLHDYKPEDRLAKSEILEKLKFLVKNIKGGAKKKTFKKTFKKSLKKNKKRGGNPSKRKRDTDYEIDQEESPEIKNILIKNYLYQIIYLAFGYINLDNDINSELIISLQNLALYLDSYQNDINNDKNYDENYKSELLINIKIAIQVINNFVKKFLDIIYPNEQLNSIQMSEQPLDLSPPLLKDDEEMYEQEDNLEMYEQENKQIDKTQNEEMDKSQNKEMYEQDDHEQMDESEEPEEPKEPMQNGGTNINNFQSNINNLIENKYFDIDIENIINNENIIHNSKKRQKQQNGGAPKKFDNDNINQLIKYYYNILKKNLTTIKDFFIQDQKTNFYIPDLNINKIIIQEINNYDEQDIVKDNNFDEEKKDPTNEYINTKLSNFLNLLHEYNNLIRNKIPNKLTKLGGEFKIKFDSIRYDTLIVILYNTVYNNNVKNINNIDQNIPIINTLFSGDNIAMQNIVYSTDEVLKNILEVYDITEKQKAYELDEAEKARRNFARAAARAAADAIKANNSQETFITRIQERKMANNILIFIGKTVKNLLKPLYTDSNIIEGKQFQLLNNYADISFNSVDKNVYGKLEESLLNLFQNTNYDFAYQLEDLSLNIYNINTTSKCYFINNAAHGTFADGSELQQYRYCPLGSLIDAAALRFGGCTYNAPTGKTVSTLENEKYIETGDIDISFNCANDNYGYRLKINKLSNNYKYQILINYKLDNKEFQTNYIHDINDSSISASNIYKNLLHLFITTLKQNPTYKEWTNFTLNIEFQKKFLAESTKKGLGDFLQTVNTVFKNGGFITNNQNYSPGDKIIKFNSSGDAPRLNLATDQISSSLLIYIANFFPQQNINKYCWGGYKSSSKLLIKKIPNDLNQDLDNPSKRQKTSFGGRKKHKKKNKKIKKRRTKKRKKLKKTNKIR